MQDRITHLTVGLGRLLQAEPVVLETLLTAKPASARVAGVYAISAKGDSEPLYIGRTKTLTILERMRDHCRGAASSDLKLIVQRHPEFNQRARDYAVRWYEVRDGGERSKLEQFAIAVLSPPFNRD